MSGVGCSDIRSPQRSTSRCRGDNDRQVNASFTRRPCIAARRAACVCGAASPHRARGSRRHFLARWEDRGSRSIRRARHSPVRLFSIRRDLPPTSPSSSRLTTENPGYVVGECGPQSALASRVGLVVSIRTSRPSAFDVPMPSRTVPSPARALSEKTSFVPSGDQPASNAVNAVVRTPVRSTTLDHARSAGGVATSPPKIPDRWKTFRGSYCRSGADP
jgi:hypothetical protein